MAESQLRSWAPSISGFAMDAESMTEFFAGDVDIFELRIDLQRSGSGSAPRCGLRLTAANTQLLGNATVRPQQVDPSKVDGYLNGAPNVSLADFQQHFSPGVWCDFPLIGEALRGKLDMPRFDALEDNAGDPHRRRSAPGRQQPDPPRRARDDRQPGSRLRERSARPPRPTPARAGALLRFERRVSRLVDCNA